MLQVIDRVRTRNMETTPATVKRKSQRGTPPLPAWYRPHGKSNMNLPPLPPLNTGSVFNGLGWLVIDLMTDTEFKPLQNT